MPNYEFECIECGNVDSLLLRMHERDEKYLCAKCGEQSIRKVSSISIGSSKHSETSTIENKTDESHFSREPRIVIENNTLTNGQVGVSLPKKANFKMSGNKFENIKTAVKLREE